MSQVHSLAFSLAKSQTNLFTRRGHRNSPTAYPSEINVLRIRDSVCGLDLKFKAIPKEILCPNYQVLY